jgi:hypothetical protein
LLFDRYIASHAREAALMQNAKLPVPPQVVMVIVGLVSGIVSGIILGIFAFVAGKLVKTSPAPASKAAA